MKRLLKILGYSLLTIILLLVLAIWLVSTEKVQNILVSKATNYFSEKLHTKVDVKHVKLAFFNSFHIEGVFIEDDKKDTLAYVGDLSLKTSDLLNSYWNNDRNVIHSVMLKDVIVHMKRGQDSSRWNYDFIVDAFSSPSADTVKKIETIPGKKAEPFDPKLDLKEVQFANIRFLMDDGWRGEDMHFEIGALTLQADALDLLRKNISIKNLAIDGANISVKEYVGGKPKDLTPDDTTTWGSPFNPDLFTVAINKLSLKNSEFYFTDGNKVPPKGEFDETNLGIKNINIVLDNTNILADTLFTDIKEMTASERCGIEVKSLTGKLKLSQVQAQLSDLLLKTNYSTVGNFYEMNYKNFHDFNEFITNVSIKAKLEKSSVSSLDIGYFANILNQYPITINLSGEAEGTIDHLVAKDLDLQTRNTSLKGSGSVVGLPDIDNTVFDFDVQELKTNGQDLNILIPQTRTDAVAWNKLSTINYKGSYYGHVDDFKTKGTLLTSLGNANLDLAMNFKPKVPMYEGHLETQHFDIGQLIKQSTIGKLSMKGDIKGSGFDLNDLNTKVNATISSIDVDGNNYQNMTVNGIVAKKQFDGIFVSQDPNMAFNFDGKLDLSGKQPSYNFNSRFLKVDLFKLGLTKDHIIGSGYVTLNFKGDNIDNFTGSALLKNVLIEKDSSKYYIENLLLESFEENNIKTLELKSTIADADLKGQFNISELANSFQLYLYHYLPEYIKKPQKYRDEAFVFNINLKNPDTLLSIFNKDFHHLSNIIFSGNLDTKKQKFSLDANILNFGYKEFLIKDLFIVGAGDFSSFDLNAVSGNFSYNNDVIIPSFQLNASMANDTAALSFNSQSINDILGEASLNCKATAINSNLYVNLLPSNISVKNDKWQLYSNNSMIFGDRITIKDFIIESGAQRIVVNTKDNATNDFVANFSMLDLEGASTYLKFDEVKIHGRVNGEAQLIDYKNNPLLKATITSNDEVRINKDTLGEVNVSAQYDFKTSKLDIFKTTQIIHGNNKLNIFGNVNIKDSSIKIIASLDKVNIAPIGSFISDYVANLSGVASGNVNVEGNYNSPTITGEIGLNNTKLKVLFLGTNYSIDQMRLRFNDEKISMDDVVIQDERAGNYTGVLSGYISHKKFTNMRLNLAIKSDNLLCMNTRSYDNDMFYGYVPANVNMTVKGLIDDITMNINAKPLKGSKFYLPINSTGDVSSYDYISFAQIGRLQGELDDKKKPYYLKLNMNVDATPDAEVIIVLDQNTGEEIQAKGNGAIQLKVDLGNDINMFGNYVMTEGKYLFNFRGLIPREFDIEEGSKITWTGDAVNATLDVNAIYQLPKQLPLYPLISGQYNNLDENDQAESKKKYTTYLGLLLKGSLGTPDIKFNITQPDNKAIGTAAYTKLEQIKNDEKELVSQAGILLLLGEFKSPQGGVTSSTASRGSIATVSDMVSSALSSEMTNIFQKLTGLRNISLNLGYQAYDAAENINNTNRNEFKVNVSANLLKNRVIVDVGNSVDVGKDGSGKTTSNFIGGDFKAQFLISEDGRFRANAYRTNSTNTIDASSGENFTKGGLGLSYRKVFNSFADLFISKKKRQRIPLTDTLNKTTSL